MKPLSRYVLIAALLLTVGGYALLRGRRPNPTPTLRVGAALAPHAEILKFIQPRLKAEGVDLSIITFDDQDQLNPALAEGTIDANFFQHLPFLNAVAKEKGYAFVSLGAVHVEPLGFYSTRISSLEGIRTGATLGIPNNPSNEYRALALLEAQGLIKLKPGHLDFSATPRDILENPRQLRFIEADIAQLPRSLRDLDGAVINTNTVLEARLDPATAIFREGPGSPYANVVVTQRAHADRPDLKKLMAALQSQEVKDFLRRTYGAAVVPAF